MSTGKSVLIIGPGFVGWNVLDLLVAEDYSVTCYVRREEHADALRASGASDIIMGDLNDKALITQHSANYDIIVHTATADHLPSVLAVLDGIKARAAKELMTVFIHTSGTNVVADGAAGQFKSATVYYDHQPEQLDAVDDKAPHRPIDLAIVRAQRELGTKAKLAILIPPLIYGYTHGRGTIQIPTLTRFALKHGYAAYVGKGLAVESNIHVLDLARAYVCILHNLEELAPEQTLANPYYFCECTGDKEPSWKDVASLIGESLHKVGKVKDPIPRPLDESMYLDLFSDVTPEILGSNSRTRAVRLRELGWAPREKDWKRSFVEDELPNLLKEDGTAFDGYRLQGGDRLVAIVE